MTQDQDAYRKIGRGGAGNFYPSKQADEAAKDIEKQELDAAATASVSSPPSSSHSAPSAVSRGGRGGAGNLVDGAATAEARQESANKTAAAVNASLKSGQHKAASSSGRGGAGNWKAPGGGDTAEHEEDATRLGEEMERKAKEAVDLGLKMPEKVHHAFDRKKDAA